MPSAILMLWPPFQNETYGDGEHIKKMWRFCQPRLVFAKIWQLSTSLCGIVSVAMDISHKTNTWRGFRIMKTPPRLTPRTLLKSRVKFGQFCPQNINDGC